MWPILLAFLRSNGVYLTLPFAAVVGAIGYNLEGLISDRFTPYSSKTPSKLYRLFSYNLCGFKKKSNSQFSESIDEKRIERLMEEKLKDPTHIEKLRLKENVLGRNLSPSLEK